MSAAILHGEPHQRFAMDVIALLVGLASMVASGHHTKRWPRAGRPHSRGRDACATLYPAATVRAVHDVGQRRQPPDAFPAITVGGADAQRWRARAAR